MGVLGKLQLLQHLTYLELLGADIEGPDAASLALQPLQALTRLVELCLVGLEGGVVTVSMLSGMTNLTHLEVAAEMELQPGAIEGLTRLQHLHLSSCWVAGVQLQQLSCCPTCSPCSS